jgi:hypothetical protein
MNIEHMKKLITKILLMTTISLFTFEGMAQTITLTATGSQTNSYNCASNQIITIDSFITSGQYGGNAYAWISFTSGVKLNLENDAYTLTSKAIFTGVTNISVYPKTSAYTVALTFTITTPTASSQSSIPANAVVIPTDATGPVQIVLESSSDLVNWTSSLPGTYGSTYTNRFFRVRAIAQ